MKRLSVLALSLVIGLGSAPLTALASGNHSGSHSSPNMAEPANSVQAPNPGASTEASADAAMTAGEIRKVNKDTGKITIKHEELKNLGMPAMTMVFRAKDKAMLDQVKAGDKVNFVADKVGGQFTVMQIEVSK